MKSLRKNKIIRTCAAVLLCFVLALPVLGLNNYAANADVEHVIRDYASLEGTKRFMVGGFYGADVTTDAGVTLLKNPGVDFTTMYGNHFEQITSRYFSSGNTSDIVAIYNRLQLYT